MNNLRRWPSAFRRYSAFYAKNLWHKAARDQLFFLSSGITFNVLVTIVPLLLITISVLGILVESSTSAREQILSFIQRVMPLASAQAESLLFGLVEDRGWLGVVGLVLCVALAATVLWTLFYYNLVSGESTTLISWIVLVLFSAILAAGMSWAHLRNRWSGQATVDEVDNP